MTELNTSLKTHLAEVGLSEDRPPKNPDDWHAFLDRVNGIYATADELENILADAHRRLALLTDHNPLAFIEWSKDYQIIEWNPAAEEIFGYTREEALKLRDINLVSPAY